MEQPKPKRTGAASVQAAVHGVVALPVVALAAAEAAGVVLAEAGVNTAVRSATCLPGIMPARSLVEMAAAGDPADGVVVVALPVVEPVTGITRHPVEVPAEATAALAAVVDPVVAAAGGAISPAMAAAVDPAAAAVAAAITTHRCISPWGLSRFTVPHLATRFRCSPIPSRAAYLWKAPRRIHPRQPPSKVARYPIPVRTRVPIPCPIP